MSLDSPEPNIIVTSYQVCCLPEDHRDHHLFALEIQRKGINLWSVMWMGETLSADGSWDVGPISSDQTEEWRAAHRFSLKEAIERARVAAPAIECNGRTVADVLAKAADQ